MTAEKINNYSQGTNVVVDTGWGDGGKGKLVDLLSQDADIVFRWAGGANAGHTVVNEYGKFKFNLMPSGIFNAETCILGSGVALDPLILIQEMKALEERGFEVNDENLLVSLDSHLVLDWHKKRDGIQDSIKGGQTLGTTKKGMGPLYADRTARTGLQLWHLYEKDFEDRFMKEFLLQTRIIRMLSGEPLLSEIPTDEHFRDLSKVGIMRLATEAMKNGPLDAETMLNQLYEAREILRPMAQNVIPVVREAHNNGKRILGEGNQGALLGLDDGTYPYVSSSDPTVSGFTKGSKIRERDINHVLGVTKAYTTRVGEGPMPTELFDDDGEHIRQVGAEFGTTTGRPRRCGWFDAVAHSYGADASGSTELALTKLDVLDDMPVVKICIGYERDSGYYPAGTVYNMPAQFFQGVTPVYEEMAGWQKPTTAAQDFEDLPHEAQEYVLRIEELVGQKARFVSVGPHRDATVYRDFDEPQVR